MDLEKRNDTINRLILSLSTFNSSWKDLAKYNPNFDQKVPLELIRHQIILQAKDKWHFSHPINEEQICLWIAKFISDHCYWCEFIFGNEIQSYLRAGFIRSVEMACDVLLTETTSDQFWTVCFALVDTNDGAPSPLSPLIYMQFWAFQSAAYIWRIVCMGDTWTHHFWDLLLFLFILACRAAKITEVHMDFDKEIIPEYDKYLAEEFKGKDCTFECDHYHYGYFGGPSSVMFDIDVV